MPIYIGLMHMRVKITLANEEGESFMGRGLAVLLRRVEALHSIHQAAQDVGLSYVKALKILNRLEANLGQPVIVRHRGGNEHGGAGLTPFGARFLSAFEKMLARIDTRGETAFKQFNKETRKRT